MKFNTELELVDYVIEKLTAQGCKSTTEDTILCMYRSPKGLKCAAGWLIDDADYDPWMENKSASEVQLRWGIFQEEYMPVIKNLQDIHDGYPETLWPEKFAELKASCGNK